MTSIENNRDPSKLELFLFALMFVVFGGVLGSLALWRPNALVVIGLVATTGWLVSMLFSQEQSRKTQLLGLVFPFLLASIFAATQTDLTPIDVAAATWAAGGLLGAGVLLNQRFGKNVYKLWALMFLPLGWTVSHLLLAVVYYGVLTPIGCAMRLLGRDPMRRGFDPTAQSYWIERKPPAGPERYFQQF